MAGKKKDDNPTPQQAANRARALRHYHKKKETSPGFLKEHAERESMARKARKARKEREIRVLLPADTTATTSDGCVLLGLNMQNKTAGVVHDFVDALKQTNALTAENVAARSDAKAPPMASYYTEQTQNDSLESEGGILDPSKEGRLSYRNLDGRFDEESLQRRSGSFELADESQGERPAHDDHTEEDFFGENAHETDVATVESGCDDFSNYLNDPSISHWIPQGAVPRDALDVLYGVKFLESKLIKLGASRRQTFGQKIDAIVGMFEVRQESDLFQELDFLLDVRNKIVHLQQVDSFDAAETSRKEFCYLVDKTGEVLDDMFAEMDEERRRLRRKRRHSLADSGGIQHGGPSQKYGRRSI